eukprot:CAMPEP_0195517570 /NCGR_PEP_ID=MMETSP0794_2-20130614/11018_1 /TAXON_ID=515487 /ORGANISM="Stephanopyxis turris, Strain CCMP 815" /LENGTH=116 /DNA_ID=CAMNT_0040646391 /DNA_START=80 /DNA_END=428 /DNA_ORIENTATION=+
MSKRSGPNLQLYMDKRLAIRLNASRNVVGVLRGFDQFMNIVLDEAVELLVGKEKHDIGMVVIRGNSIVQMECLDPSRADGNCPRIAGVDADVTSKQGGSSELSTCVAPSQTLHVHD